MGKRYARCRKLKSRHDGKNLDKIVFSDEKLFGVEEKLNAQNTRIYSLCVKDEPEKLHTVQHFQKENKVNRIWHQHIKQRPLKRGASAIYQTSTSEWPLSSSDLNPLDYSIWGILEARVNTRRDTSLESLKAMLFKE